MPAKARDLIRALASLGITTETPASGSHWLLRCGSRKYPLPLHNGPKTEVNDAYVRGVCRAFGIDLTDLKKLL